MNRLGLIEYLKQQIVSLEDELEAGITDDGQILDTLDEYQRIGMINQCELIIDKLELEDDEQAR